MTSTVPEAEVFPILFTGMSKWMRVLGITPSRSFVAVSDVELRVQLSYTFRLTVPLQSVQSAELNHDRVTGWGAHGLRGTWLVNGSSSGLVRISFDAPWQASVVGVPKSMTKVSVLRVSVVDPEGLVAALTR